MTLTVNVRWHEGTALFVVAGEAGAEAFDLMRAALEVARTDAETIVIDVSDAKLADGSLVALRHALDSAKIVRPVVVCGSDGVAPRVDRVLGARVVVVESLDGDLRVGHDNDGADPGLPRA